MKRQLRSHLLAVAPRLAERVPYSALSVERVCAAGGVAPGAFRLAFDDLSAYVQALHAHFLEQMRQRLIKVTEGTAPGLRRIMLASETYLGYNLENAALRHWLLAAYGQPGVLHAIRQQTQIYGLLLAAEMRVAGRARADALARLYLAMLNEVAGIELRAGGRQNAYRDALWHFLDHAGAPAPFAPALTVR